ncbi:hypothetical protein Hdeb2414_s0058g00759221 [Helianthus debilis subsp. tardiflorus]
MLIEPNPNRTTPFDRTSPIGPHLLYSKHGQPIRGFRPTPLSREQTNRKGFCFSFVTKTHNTHNNPRLSLVLLGNPTAHTFQTEDSYYSDHLCYP